MRYLYKTKYNTYKIRIRIPIELQHYFRGRKEINKSLNTKNLVNARKKASILIADYEKLLLSHNLNILDNKIMEDKFNTFLSKNPTNKKTVIVKKEFITYAQALSKFVEYYKELDIDKDKKRATINFLNEVYIKLRGESELISTTLFSDVNMIKNQLVNLPRRNLKQYSNKPLKSLLKINIPAVDKISPNTLKSYMKYISRFYNFCIAQQFINVNPCRYVNVKSSTNEIDEREAFEQNEISKLLEIIDIDCDIYKKVIYYALIYTGMRISELYKADIKCTNDGIHYFDLTNPHISLKTKSSRRLIPFHSKLENLNAHLLLPKALMRYKLNWIRRVFNENLKYKITASKKKVLYSLRHTVASQLKYHNVNPLIISEILGHSHSGTTMERYASRYPLQTLKEAIELL